MAKIEIYTWSTCPFCKKAKKLLDSKGVEYTEYQIDGDEKARDEMAKLTGGERSVPQIFVNGQHIGDCTEIHRLDDEGQLDDILRIGGDNNGHNGQGGMRPA